MNMFEYLYSFEHYRPVIDFGAARCAKSAQELADHVNAYLQDQVWIAREEKNSSISK